MADIIKRVDIIVVGLEHVRHAFASLANGLATHDIYTLFYSQDISGYTTDHYPVNKIKAPSNMFINFYKFAQILLRYKPRHVEVYLHYGNNLISIGHLIISKLLNIPIVVVCTGGEILYWKRHKPLRKFTVKFALSLAKIVIIKELYMRDYINEYCIGDINKTYLLNNRITIRESYTIARNNHIVLFLNSFKPWRHVDTVVRAASQVINEIPDVVFYLVGARNEKEYAPIKKLVDEFGLNDHVFIRPWEKNVISYYENSSIFVLPADIIFCNNSLLEAMERGTPPIVADVPGAELIVENGISGLRVSQTPEAVARAIITLLTQEDLRQRLGQGARSKIESDFDERQRSKFLKDLYMRKVWNIDFFDSHS